MLLEVTLPAAVDPADLTRRLDALADELGVDCTLHPSDADIL
jgi:glycine cleavage system regulatory protein